MKAFLCGLVVLAMGFCSCQREVDGIIQTRTQADSTYLLKIYSLDTTLPAGSDTIEKSFFQYDSQKRLARFYFYVVGSIDTFIHEYRYSGNDTLPYLEIQKSVNSGGPGTYYYDSAFYFYNNGLVSKDSIINWEYPGPVNHGVVVSAYTSAGGTVTRRDRYYDLVAGSYVLSSIDSGKFTIAYTGGNMTGQVLTDGTGYYDFVQATYDNKPNPLNKVFKTRYPNFEGYFLDNWGIQLTNFTQVQWVSGFNPPVTETSSYRYRADGYPTSVSYFDSGGSSGYNKLLFFYTSL